MSGSNLAAFRAFEEGQGTNEIGFEVSEVGFDLLARCPPEGGAAPEKRRATSAVASCLGKSAVVTEERSGA